MLLVVLAVNGLTVGPIPTEVGQLDKLCTLRLGNNQLTGKNKVSDVVVVCMTLRSESTCHILCMEKTLTRSRELAKVPFVSKLFLRVWSVGCGRADPD